VPEHLGVLTFEVQICRPGLYLSRSSHQWNP
jgi:hypothetical protein